jgi:hypothetical protein
MLYVARDSQGRISELHPMPFAGAKEGLPADNAEVLQFIHARWRQNELADLDREFVRAIEDTIELLITKGVILFTDLPGRVQDKLLRRKEIRSQTNFSPVYSDDSNDVIKF